jgi:hypothetical protein
MTQEVGAEPQEGCHSPAPPSRAGGNPRRCLNGYVGAPMPWLVAKLGRGRRISPHIPRLTQRRMRPDVAQVGKRVVSTRLGLNYVRNVARGQTVRGACGATFRSARGVFPTRRGASVAHRPQREGLPQGHVGPGQSFRTGCGAGRHARAYGARMRQCQIAVARQVRHLPQAVPETAVVGHAASRPERCSMSFRSEIETSGNASMISGHAERGILLR